MRDLAEGEAELGCSTDKGFKGSDTAQVLQSCPKLRQWDRPFYLHDDQSLDVGLPLKGGKALN